MIAQYAVAHAGVQSSVSTTETFISKKETAKRLNCGIRTLDNWMGQGIVPYYKISKKVLFKWSEVESTLKRNCQVDRGSNWKI